ncbi:hypothetical protein N7495_009094 [Penicillium taxi]|uniref:uncharacterized protein n=1 Tax=Penicillium taxi TaxID=168475 RepID=UPI002544F47B|nr:uncharacterized protein N7495_009094 [Penicillium taxi]KAJ5889053.1 hypothetical protein N7495_009094 [Penicillium taxi]
MKVSVLFPLASILSLVVSQTDPNNPDNMSPCLLVCNEQAAQAAGCLSFTDTDCTCPKQYFTDFLKQCLNAACTKDDYDREF